MPQTPTEDCKLKAGHPPAVKAGGMRITQHKSGRERVDSVETDEPVVSVSPPKQHIKQIINGVVAKGDADFPPEAVKAFHENKPQPAHEYRHNPTSSKPVMIQQPRK